MPFTLAPDVYKIGEMLGLPIPPKPIAYLLTALLLLLPLVVLYYSSILPSFLPLLSVIVLLIYAYLGYLGWRATHIVIGKEFDG